MVDYWDYIASVNSTRNQEGATRNWTREQLGLPPRNLTQMEVRAFRAANPTRASFSDMDVYQWAIAQPGYYYDSLIGTPGDTVDKLPAGSLVAYMAARSGPPTDIENTSMRAAVMQWLERNPDQGRRFGIVPAAPVFQSVQVTSNPETFGANSEPRPSEPYAPRSYADTGLVYAQQGVSDSVKSHGAAGFLVLAGVGAAAVLLIRRRKK